MHSEDALPDYVSSAPLLVGDSKPTVEDEADLPTLEKVLLLLNKRAEEYRLISSLDLSQTEFKIKQQAAINKEHLLLISELQSLIGGAINKVREL